MFAKKSSKKGSKTNFSSKNLPTQPVQTSISSRGSTSSTPAIPHYKMALELQFQALFL